MPPFIARVSFLTHSLNDTKGEMPYFKEETQLSNSYNQEFQSLLLFSFPTTIYLWLISLTASKELSILLLKLLE